MMRRRPVIRRPIVARPAARRRIMRGRGGWCGAIFVAILVLVVAIFICRYVVLNYWPG